MAKKLENKYDRVCFVCGRPMAPVDLGEAADPNDIPFLAPINGTMWESTGNYGSGIFDSFGMETDMLHIVICDPCLKAGAKRAYHAKVTPRPSKIEAFKGIEGVTDEADGHQQGRSDELG